MLRNNDLIPYKCGLGARKTLRNIRSYHRVSRGALMPSVVTLRHMIAMQDEDLMPHAFGLEVEDHHCVVGGSAKCLAALSLAEDRLNAGPRSAATPNSASGKPGQQGSPPAAGGSGTRQAQQQQQQGQPAQRHGQQAQLAAGGADTAGPGQSGADPAMRAALLARLRFRRHLHKVETSKLPIVVTLAVQCWLLCLVLASVFGH